jgi:hypothetical protein
MNEQIVEFRHNGAEDYLGHSAIVRVRGHNAVVVMSNGDRDGVEWAPDVASTLVELLGVLACASPSGFRGPPPELSGWRQSLRSHLATFCLVRAS